MTLILGIESSCDETAAAVVEDGRRVLSSIVASQTDMHMRFGGVVPEIAARQHLRVIDPLIQDTLREAGVTMDQIDAIAVTQGPGLIGAILVGVSYAKALALTYGKPLVPVDHVRAHVHGALLGVDVPGGLDAIFPCMAMVVSGGHSNLYFMASPVDYELMAHSVDDACGECFDKVAKLMGFPYPGGPAIEKLARSGNAANVRMPRMVGQKSKLMFSYAGLKTHMVNLWRQRAREIGGPVPESEMADMCAAFQDEAFEQLTRKISVAAASRPESRSLLVAGGVAANGRMREMIAERIRLKPYFPHPRFCADNGAMIASYGYHIWRSGRVDPTDLGWDAYSRYGFQASSAT